MRSFTVKVRLTRRVSRLIQDADGESYEEDHATHETQIDSVFAEDVEDAYSLATHDHAWIMEDGEAPDEIEVLDVYPDEPAERWDD